MQDNRLAHLFLLWTSVPFKCQDSWMFLDISVLERENLAISEDKEILEELQGLEDQ